MCDRLIHRQRLVATSCSALCLLHASAATAFDLNPQFSIDGILAGAGQCQNVSALLPSEGYGQQIDGTDPLEYDTGLEKFDDECRGGVLAQFEIAYHPTDNDQLFVALGWAEGNVLNDASPFRLAPWAVDLEDEVKDINGSSRDYLLQAWYRHRLDFEGDNSIAGTFGLIKSTNYLDLNEYANDEYTQFMNEAFVNAGNYGLPSYDAGVAVESEFGSFSVNAVGMNINENDEGNNYNFWGVQIGWHPEFKLGAGNYRVNLVGTSSAFSAPADGAAPGPNHENLALGDGGDGGEVPSKKEARLAWGLSFDQAIGEGFGVFTRLVWQSDDAAVDYEALYSGGINILGSRWRRPDDNIGLGYAYLEGGNTGVKHSNVFEVYYQASINEYLALSVDAQYQDDSLVEVDPRQRDPVGWTFGLRATAEF
jgi:porin